MPSVSRKEIHRWLDLSCAFGTFWAPLHIVHWLLHLCQQLCLRRYIGQNYRRTSTEFTKLPTIFALILRPSSSVSLPFVDSHSASRLCSFSSATHAFMCSFTVFHTVLRSLLGTKLTLRKLCSKAAALSKCQLTDSLSTRSFALVLRVPIWLMLLWQQKWN